MYTRKDKLLQNMSFQNADIIQIIYFLTSISKFQNSAEVRFNASFSLSLLFFSLLQPHKIIQLHFTQEHYMVELTVTDIGKGISYFHSVPSFPFSLSHGSEGVVKHVTQL